MAQRREPAIPIFATELSRATESYVDEDKGEYSPTYLISDMGAKLYFVDFQLLKKLQNQ